MSSKSIVTIENVSCYEQDGTAYLRLEDVARGLGFTRTAASGNEVVMWSRVNGYLSDLGVHTCAHDDYIPENIFYRLAMKAKNATAEKFQALVADEIIPSIRKHGAYMTPETLQAAILNPDTLIQLCQQLKNEQNKNRELTEKNAQLASKGLFADAVSTSDHCILIGELAKLLQQNGIETGQNRLYEQLRTDGFLVKDRKRSDFNMPTQKAMELGLFKVRESTRIHSDGHTSIDRTTKVTGKGQVYLINYYLKNR